MAVNAANARIFGSDNDAVSIAPLGTALPTTLAPLAAPFTDVGWLGTDGIPFTPGDSVDRIRGFQGNRVVRTSMTESGLSFTFQALETTALTVGLQHNIRTKETTAGVTRATASSGRGVEARVIVVDVYDKDDESIHYRYAFERAEIGERSEFTLSNTDITGYTFSVEVIGDFDIITNDPAFEDAA